MEVFSFREILNYFSYNKKIPSRCINNCFGKLRLLSADQEYAEDFNKFIKKIMSSIVEKVGWEPKEDEHHTRVRRVFSLAFKLIG